MCRTIYSIPCMASFIHSLCKRKILNTPGSQQIRGGGISGEGWIEYKRWRPYWGITGKSEWGHNWRQTGGHRLWLIQEGKLRTLLDRQKKVKKDKHGKHFHKHCEHFFLFVLNVDGMLEKDSPIIPANLSQLMAAKMKEPNSHVWGCVNGRIEIAVARL